MSEQIILRLKKLHDFFVVLPEYFENADQIEKELYPYSRHIVDTDNVLYNIIREEEKRAEPELEKIVKYITEKIGDLKELKGRRNIRKNVNEMRELEDSGIFKKRISCKREEKDEILGMKSFLFGVQEELEEVYKEVFSQITKMHDKGTFRNSLEEEEKGKKKLELYQKKGKEFLNFAQNIIKEPFREQAISLLRKRVCNLELSKEEDKDEQKRKKNLIECVFNELEILIKEDLFCKIGKVIYEMLDNIKCVQCVDTLVRQKSWEKTILPKEYDKEFHIDKEGNEVYIWRMDRQISSEYGNMYYTN